ncbi:hypothetical protein DH2020_003762 [Rehmannia glutinosa]|uniref:Uncharacterized protein n=1 Tax=Rehmannia glutinosa TaxID=99300 RepID=A0ABR0XMY6_REHGL
MILGIPRKSADNLKGEIERMVMKGWLDGWVKMDRGQASNAGRIGITTPTKEGRGNAGGGKEDHPPRGTINMIGGGPTDGDSNRARKAHARGEIRPIMEVGVVREPVVSFGAEDRRVYPYCIMMPWSFATIANFEVARIMVDTGSSVNVLFYEAYLRMGVEMETALNAFQAIISTFHMKLKFVIEYGVGKVLGDHRWLENVMWRRMKGEEKKSKRKEVEAKGETNPLKMTERKENEERHDECEATGRGDECRVVIGDPTKVTRIGA